MTPENKALLESRRKPTGRFGERGFSAADMSLGTAPGVALTFEDLEHLHEHSVRIARVARHNLENSIVALAARGILEDFPSAATVSLTTDWVEGWITEAEVHSADGTVLGTYDVDSMDRTGATRAARWIDQLQPDTKEAAWKNYTVAGHNDTIDLAAAAAWVPLEDPAP